ncbi:O-methyltransferase [Saccharothrix australiensis]|uniref:Putative O-methyltransferase YrrM n=1 Tax=Saccharothrix australiensis TaxID=2072 RepID=A0A495VTF0_9PSEU|nr:O-methyltransferase [Saccharothrix australiensis]RKT52646.1 putative O-methyltransferase YrrM [Saccharothrix australiensis]
MDAPLREYVERYQPEDAVTAAARARGVGLGCASVGAAGGAVLRFLATALRAKAVVEVGTGAGVGSLYLLGGMPPAGVLTSIDAEPEHQRVARVAFAEAGVAVSRTRLITGRAPDVLPRLTDGAYDLVFVGAVGAGDARYLQEGVRLLRPGGVIAFDGVLRDGRVADPAHRDPDTVAARDVARAVREDDRLVPVLLPLGDGLLVAAKSP